MLRVSDLASGLIVAGIGIAVVMQSMTFPAAVGVPVGPSLYPGIIGTVLVVLGLSLAISAVTKGQALPIADYPSWLKPGRPLIAVVAIPVAIAGYALLATELGFLATALGVMFGLLLAFGVRPRTSVLVAVLVSGFLYVLFRVLMRVPLPVGLIERMLP